MIAAEDIMTTGPTVLWSSIGAIVATYAISVVGRRLLSPWVDKPKHMRRER